MRVLVVFALLLVVASAQRVFTPATDNVDQCCAVGVAFNSATQLCCNGTVHNNPQGALLCCGSRTYDPNTQTCCGPDSRGRFGVISNANGAQCCGINSFNPTSQTCCAETVNNNGANLQCCGTRAFGNQPNQVCCIDNIGNGDACCLRTAFNSSSQTCCGPDGSGRFAVVSGASQQCCGTSALQSDEICCLFSRVRNNLQCCGNRGFDPASQTCCNNTVVSGANRACCGNRGFDPATQTCCEDFTSSVVNGLVSDTQQCCGGRFYNPNTQTCCAGNVVSGSILVNSNLQCCGTRSLYDPRNSTCCSGNVNNNFAEQNDQGIAVACCGTRAYDAERGFCCPRNTLLTDFNLVDAWPTAGFATCCGFDEVYNPGFEVCCHGKNCLTTGISGGSTARSSTTGSTSNGRFGRSLFTRASTSGTSGSSGSGTSGSSISNANSTFAGNACCGNAGSQVGYNTNFQLCCNGVLHDANAPNLACCGTDVYLVNRATCCQTISNHAIFDGLNLSCCGTVTYDPITQICC